MDWLRSHIARRGCRWTQVWSVIDQVTLDGIVRALLKVPIVDDGSFSRDSSDIIAGRWLDLDG